MSKTKDLAIGQVEPNNYNPNVLKGEKFEALKKDVAAGNYDPILVSPKDVFYGKTVVKVHLSYDKAYVIIDGQWRYTAAKELGLKTIRAEIRILMESEAKPITFKKNRQRGNLDPFKEATLFDEEVRGGLTEQQVADRFRVTRSYVAGRRSLLKVSAEVVEFFEAPEKKLKARLEQKIREDVEERRGQPEYVEVSDEDVQAHIEKEVAEVVPRGTLTPGHLRPLSSLPEKHQAEVAEDIVHTGLSVRDTEEKVQRVHEDLETAKRFKEALEKARQPTCPVCGAAAKGFSYSGESHFSCSSCYNRWDFMVTKKELDERKKQRAQEEKGEKSQRLKDAHSNPAFIRRLETVEEIDAKIKPWILKKLHELDGILRIEVTGSRGKDIVSFEYPGSWKNSLSFDVGTTQENSFYPYKWENKFGFSMENKSYKTVDAKSKLDIQDPSPEKRAAVHKFLDEVVNTDQDPFLPTKTAKQASRKSEE